MPNPAHLHLLVNHFPIVAAFLAVPLLLLALWRRRDRGILLGAVVVLAAAGASGVAAYRTGEPAQDQVEEMPAAQEADIGEHEDRAKIAMWAAGVTALAGIVIWIFATRRPPDVAVPAWWVLLLLAGALVTSGLMAWTGNAGGVIMHTEVRGDWPDKK